MSIVQFLETLGASPNARSAASYTRAVEALGRSTRARVYVVIGMAMLLSMRSGCTLDADPESTHLRRKSFHACVGASAWRCLLSGMVPSIRSLTLKWRLGRAMSRPLT